MPRDSQSPKSVQPHQHSYILLILDTLSPFSTHSLRLYLLSHRLISISRLPFGCYSYAMRRDSEVPLEVGNGISMQGCRNVSQIVLERRKENNEHDMLVLEYVLSLSFRFGHSSVIHYSFLALPPRYHHQCQFTLRSCESTGFSLCSIVLASLVPTPHYLHYIPPKFTILPDE